MGNKTESNSICSLESCSLERVILPYSFLKGQSFSLLCLCPVLNLCIQFDWLIGSGVYEEALVSFFAGGEEK